jgi:hypothetical protein
MDLKPNHSVFDSENAIMSNAKSSWSKWSMISLTVVALAAFSVLARAQDTHPIKVGNVEITGLPDDWSHRHVIFSNPGTERDAIWNGTQRQWTKVVSDPRYILQQIRRGSAAQGPAAADVNWIEQTRRANELAAEREAGRRNTGEPGPHRDWAFSLGTGTVAQNMYPAKFTFSTTSTPSCTADYVAYGLNVAGTTGTSGHANMVALNELYSNTSETGYCSGQTGPGVYWAYDVSAHGGPISTSPVLSGNGADIIFVESVSGGSYLHVLVWNSSDASVVTGSTGHPVIAPTNSTATVGACPVGASCLMTVELKTTTGTSITSSTVTDSSPFYDYSNDIVYVGDDNGNLFKITPVLRTGTPAITGVSVASGSVLTGPVYDATNGDVFVGASNGALYAVNPGTMAVVNNIQVGDTSCSGADNNKIVDAPIVDASHSWVYTETTDNGSDDVVVVQASTAGITSSTWPGQTSTASLGSADTGCNSSNAMYTHDPDFDNAYYNGTVTAGHMWVCARNSTTPQLDEVPTSGTNGALSTGTPGTSAITHAASHQQCSPLTEFYNTATSTDYLFFGMGPTSSSTYLNGYTLSGTNATALTPYATPVASGGTSAIVIDNAANTSTYAQASSIYFTTQAASTTVCRTTSAYCAIKLTQSALQ